MRIIFFCCKILWRYCLKELFVMNLVKEKWDEIIQKLKIDDSIVKGETTYTTYKEETENTSSFNLKFFIIQFGISYVLVPDVLFQYRPI